MEKGDFVMVKDFEVKLLKRRVVEDIGDTILICKEEESESALKHGGEPLGVGFKKIGALSKGQVTYFPRVDCCTMRQAI